MSLDDWIRGVTVVARNSEPSVFGHSEVSRLARIYERHAEIYGRVEAEKYTIGLVRVLQELYKRDE